MSDAVRILAVDDDDNILFTLGAIGKTAGWHVDGVADGQQALDTLREGPAYDLVLLDYHMPNMNGLIVLEHLREDFADLPVLVLTVDEDLETAEKFLDAGATDFALKPIKAADLIARIRLHLRLARAEQRLEQPSVADDLPKGIQHQTLAEIMRAVRDADDFITQQHLAEETGFAYQTVCRYVSYLEETGHIDVKLDYGKLGRPRKTVRWHAQ